MQKYTLHILFTIITFHAFSQANENLNKQISVSFKNTKIEAALADIESKTNIRFSYNSAIFNNNANINYSANNQSLKEILLEILDGGVSYKTRGNYIILQKKKDVEKDFLVMGYISNELTNERVFNASIYEPTTLASTLSNKYGYYQIRLRRDLNTIDLKVQKRDFLSETVKVPFRKDGKLNIGIAQKVIKKPFIINSLESIQIKPDTLKPIELDSITQLKPFEIESINPLKPIENVPTFDIKETQKTKPFQNFVPTVKAKSEQFMDWLMSSTQKIHFNNINDSLSRPFQLSFLPFIGTNGRLSSTVSNDVSINVISGVSKSVNKFEAGGFLNLIRENMTGVQMAGFGNIVGKNLSGLQLAGFSNINFGTSEGVLGAGFTNVIFGKSSGLMMAGFSNHNNKYFKGMQMAGFANISLESINGLQMAGFANVVKDTLIGSQIGTFNIANKMKNGVQIGFFNYMNESEKVLPIGFFSFVAKGGYRRLELATNELGVAEISFKTGVRSFYNIFSIQYNTRVNSLLKYNFGYGLGTSAKITNKLSADLNVIVSQFISTDWNPENWNNHMANANLNLELKLGKRLALFGGPSLNWYTTTNDKFDFSTLKTRNSNTANFNLWGLDQKQYTWLGFKAGIRLCNIF